MDYSRYQNIVAKKEGKVLTLSLNRPEQLNAINEHLHKELTRIFKDAREDAEANVIVLTGAGDAFCSGGDIRWIKELASDKKAAPEILKDGKQIITDLLEIEKPIIARVNGPAIGLGATLALFCDIIIASEKAKFGDPHVKVGLVAGDGGCVIWPLLIGICKAKEMLLTGDMITAKEAERIGLINRVVPVEELDKEVYRLAQKLADSPMRAINYTKIAVNKNVKFFANLILDTSLALEGQTLYTEDLKEATSAFLEKRKPVFKGY